MKSRKPDPITVHVGRRLRLARQAARLSQTQVGNAIGVSFQQIQKCEKGTNRIGAARLLRLAALLNVPVTFFYESLSDDLAQEVSAGLNWSAPAHPLTRLSPDHDARAILRLAWNYTAIEDKGIRLAISGLLRQLAAASTQAE